MPSSALSPPLHTFYYHNRLSFNKIFLTDRMMSPKKLLIKPSMVWVEVQGVKKMANIKLTGSKSQVQFKMLVAVIGFGHK